MPILDNATFTRGDLPTVLSKDKVDLCKLAAMMGWSLHVDSQTTTVTIISPDESKRYHLGKRSSIPIKRMQRDIIRLGNDVSKAVAGGVVEGFLPDEVLLALPNMSDPGVVTTHEPEQEVHSVKPTIISTQPMLAKGRNEDTGYLSDTTLERKWSDGTTDYACTACDFTSPNRMSPSRHYGNVHTQGMGTQPRPPEFKADVPEAATYAPQQRRVDALAAALKELLDPGEYGVIDPQAVARQALTWVHDQSKRKTDLAVEREEMSAEEMLSRIRHMLDQGQYASQQQTVADLEEKVTALTSTLHAAQEHAAQQEAQVHRYKSDLDGLRDLLNSIGQNEAAAQ